MSSYTTMIGLCQTTNTTTTPTTPRPPTTPHSTTTPSWVIPWLPERGPGDTLYHVWDQNPGKHVASDSKDDRDATNKDPETQIWNPALSKKIIGGSGDSAVVGSPNNNTTLAPGNEHGKHTSHHILQSTECMHFKFHLGARSGWNWR